MHTALAILVEVFRSLRRITGHTILRRASLMSGKGTSPLASRSRRPYVQIELCCLESYGARVASSCVIIRMLHTSTELCNTTDQGLRMGRCGTRSFFYVTSVELQAQQTSISDAIQIRSTKVKPKSPSAHPHRYTTILGTIACSQLEARRVALHKSAQASPHTSHYVVPG
jgi:hypothetical protein